MSVKNPYKVSDAFDRSMPDWSFAGIQKRLDAMANMATPTPESKLGVGFSAPPDIITPIQDDSTQRKFDEFVRRTVSGANVDALLNNKIDVDALVRERLTSDIAAKQDELTAMLTPEQRKLSMPDVYYNEPAQTPYGKTNFELFQQLSQADAAKQDIEEYQSLNIEGWNKRDLQWRDMLAAERTKTWEDAAFKKKASLAWPRAYPSIEPPKEPEPPPAPVFVDSAQVARLRMDLLNRKRAGYLSTVSGGRGGLLGGNSGATILG